MKEVRKQFRAAIIYANIFSAGPRAAYLMEFYFNISSTLRRRPK